MHLKVEKERELNAKRVFSYHRSVEISCIRSYPGVILANKPRAFFNCRYCDPRESGGKQSRDVWKII
jgi:hypothetical protein